jgi:arylsulfatase A-like enzyme
LTGRGFDEYYQGQGSVQDVNITERVDLGSDLTGPATTQRVLSWLDQHKAQPFFLYVHFIEPHSPYDPPPEDDIFKSDAYPYLFDTGYDIAHAPLKRLAMLGDQKAIDRLYQLYDGKIHFIDRYVGKILDRLQQLGLADNTLVVLTSDHGELLYSHPRDFLTFDHRSLYDTDLHIPLIIAGPHVPHGRVINALASNIDTAPTILDLAGLPPLSDAEGRSLVPLIDGAKQSLFNYVYAEEDEAIPLRSVRTAHYKLIRNLWNGKEQLFNLEADPQELHNIIREHPPALKDLEAHLDEWMKQNEPSKAVQIRRWRIYTAAQNVVTVDDMTIGGRFLITGGGWHSDTAPESGNYEAGCFWTESGNGSRTAVWRNDDPMLGEYTIYVYFGHPSVGRLATDAPFTVVTDSGAETVHLDFSRGAGEWHLLGSFHDPRYVRMTNAANGAVIADAVKFVRVSVE